MAGCRRRAPTTNPRLGKRLTWIIDPIDGTRSYLAGREDWCVCVALVEDARPVMAAVFAPSTDEFFMAVRGQGATCNGVPVRATTGTAMDFSRVAGPKPLVERLVHPRQDITLYPRIGSLALRLCWIANGRLDAAFAGGPEPGLGSGGRRFDRPRSEW